MTSGNISHDGDTASINFTRRLPYRIEAVWAALTEPEQRAEWFGATKIEPHQGGMIEMTADGPPVASTARFMSGSILVWQPPYILEHEWHQSLVGKTIVRYELTPDGDGTLLRLTHRLLSQRNAEGFIPGTHAYLDRLEAYLGNRAVPDWGQRFAELRPLYTTS